MSLQDVLSLPEASAARRSADGGESGVAMRARASAQDLLARLLGLRGRARAAAAPRVNVRISVYSPAGRPAVAIRLGSSRPPGQ